MTKFGFELEVRSGASSVLRGLRDDGLTGHQRLHYYHCDCTDCRPAPLFGSEQYPFKAQEDSTADGEFISGIFTYGSRESARAIRGLSKVLLEAGAGTSGNVGNHVHVDATELREDETGASRLRLMRLFARYQQSLEMIASGGRDNVRGYNSPMYVRGGNLWTRTAFTQRERRMDYGTCQGEYNYMDGSYLAWKRHTIEFRLWNSTRAAWRIRTNVGLSVAMVRAAIAGADCTERDPRVLEDVIGPYIDAQTWAGILRQRFAKGGLEAAI